MHVFHYDEPATVARLEALPERLRVTFALLAASRIAPSYDRFHSRTGRGDARAFRALLERLWRDVEGDEMGTAELEASVARAKQLMPSEDEGWDDMERPYAEDAAAALAYALRARMTADPQEASAVSRRAYDAIDDFVQRMNSATNLDEAAILSHPLVQAELARQHRDLNDLATTTAGRPELARLRERSEEESRSFFGGAG
jgi:uncharacterized protein YjaG (DUF416 family)